ncbi:hypothetical protein ACET3Z_007947 [Daucus carota]
MCGDHCATYNDMYDDNDDSDLEDYEGLSDYDIYCGPYYNPFSDDPDLGALSSFREMLAIMQAMYVGNSSDSE